MYSKTFSFACALFNNFQTLRIIYRSPSSTIVNVKIAEMVVHKTIIRSFHIDLHSEHKSCLLPQVEWNIKGCKTKTDLHTQHAEVNFFITICSCWPCWVFTCFAHADYAAKCQMSKESLIILSNVLFHSFTKLKQYEQRPEKYNSIFIMYYGFAA